MTSVVNRKLTDILSLRCDEENALTLYPWIHQFSNNKMSSDQTRPVSFPDVNPQSLPADSDFSMVAGDFQEVYSEPGEVLWIFAFYKHQQIYILLLNGDRDR